MKEVEALISSVGNVARTLLPFAVLCALWQLLASASGLSSYFVPRPSDVIPAFGDLWTSGVLPQYISDSLWRWGIGVGAATVVGVLIAAVVALMPRVRDAVLPLFGFFYGVAELAWLPLFVLWFGYSFTTVVACIAYSALFPVLYNAITGMRAVPAATIEALETMGANRLQVLQHVLLPGALPSIVTGFRIGASFGFRALIGAEMLSASTGIGYLIFEGRETGQTARTAAGMIIIGCLWLVIERMYIRPLEWGTVERWGMLR